MNSRVFVHDTIRLGTSAELEPPEGASILMLVNIASLVGTFAKLEPHYGSAFLSGVKF